MAIRTNLSENLQRHVYRTTWSGLLNLDTGTPESVARFAAATVQVKGTFGAAGSVSIEGSNDGGTTWAIINDTRGEASPATFTAADVRRLNERPLLIRPNVTAGDGTTNLTVLITLSVDF